MKPTLINHSGNVQWKFIIKNMDDVREYHKVNTKQHTEHVLDFSGQPNSIREAMKEIAKITGESILITGFKMADEKIMLIQKAIHIGKTVVVNLAGGWTFWDDSAMSEVKESPTDIVGSEYFSKVKIEQNEVLVLENQETIPEHIPLFIQTVLKQRAFSSVVHLDADYNNQLTTWIQEAIRLGCNTIVAETQLINKEQLLKIVTLFKNLPSFTFHIFTTGNLRELLSELIGEVETNLLFEKHNIVIH